MRHLKSLAFAFLAVVATAHAQAAHFLFEVASVTNRVYLFGTVHAGKTSWYPLAPPIERAFEESAILVVEADITDANAIMKSAAAMMYTGDDVLKNHVDAADYARFVKLLARYSLPEPQVSKMKPFMAVSLMVFSEWARAGFNPELGVDAYLIRKAKGQLKPIVEIEGIDTQIRLMDSLTDKDNELLFRGTLEALESGLTREQITGMVGAWSAGELDGILAVARQYNDKVAGAREFEEKFIWGRHEPMVARIEEYLMTKDRHFIAVGALHLAGPRGLVALLRKRGYIVKQL